MRVVHVGFHLDRHRRPPNALLDAWRPLTKLATALARAGVDITVVLPAHRSAEVRRDHVTYRFVRERPALLRRGTPDTRPVRAPARGLARAVASARPDAIHVHGLGIPVHARNLASRLPDTPILAQDHADRPPRPWRRFLARRHMRAFDALAFTAAEQVAPFLEAGVIPPDVPVFEVPEASTDFTPGDRERARTALGVYGEPCLAWVGRLDANKDPLTVLRGLAAAVPDLPDPHLWCCYGTADLLPAVKAEIAGDPRLRDRVHLLGRRPHGDVQTLLRAADALVQGSHREGSGFAVIETMACGATPVVTDIPPFRALTGDVGVLWETGQPAALATALRRLRGVSHEATAPGATAREPGDPAASGKPAVATSQPEARRRRVRARFEAALSWNAIASRLLEAYEMMVQRSTGRRSPRPRSAGAAS